MKAFTDLYSRLDQTTKTNAKIDYMAEYFSQTDAKDAIWAIALLTGRRPKRPIKTTDLKIWATELAQIPFWLFEDSYNVVGDLAETISLLIPTTSDTSTISLTTLMNDILMLINKPDEEKKSWLLSFWQTFSKDELFVFNKLITGSFRVGVSQQLVFKALAKVFSLDDKVIAHKLMGSWLPQETDIKQLLQDDGSSDHSKPYPFYLAYQLDMKPEELGNIND